MSPNESNIKATVRKRELFLADYENATDPLAEAFRMLRLQVQSAFADSESGLAQIILITSSMEKEGKTTIACNLAQICAIAHIKTLLVDLDLRKPTVHDVFKIPRVPGVTDLLLSEDPMD